jgi:Ca-activated chloride channel family protein
VPPVLFLAAIAVMLFAVSRPVTVMTLPAQHETVVLAMDVSGSMRATDIKPNRLVAAQAAAKAFVEDQPRTMRIGVVSFAATATVVQYPTTTREDVLNAIDRFQPQRGTAIGSAIIVSLSALFPDGIDVAALLNEGDSPRRWGNPRKSDKKDEFKPVPPGSYNGGAIVLITDGQSTAGADVAKAVKLAAERGVRIYPVGIGTPKGETIGFEGMSMRVKLDEDALKRIADQTRGAYYQAASPADLKRVYEALNARLSLEKKEIEVSAIVAAVAALLAALAAGLSLLWFNRIL